MCVCVCIYAMNNDNSDDVNIVIKHNDDDEQSSSTMATMLTNEFDQIKISNTSMMKLYENPNNLHNDNDDDDQLPETNSSSSSSQSSIEYICYKNETQMPDIMRLIQKDLSEPYSIYTYRYFIHNWPQLCFLVNFFKFDCFTIIMKIFHLFFLSIVNNRQWIRMYALEQLFVNLIIKKEKFYVVI